MTVRAAANALYVRWRATPTIARLQGILERVESVARTYGRPIAFIMEQDASAGAPDAEFRRRSVEAVDSVGHAIACLAMVTRASGLRAAILRSVLTGITFLARRQFPVRVFAGLDEEAQNWIVGHADGDEHARSELQALLREVEQEHTQASAASGPAERS
ncbi:MAG: hypothetical protein HYS27_10545 [Deltaproteobacteria bacterium]|nr:hypothetical protein [Deltaproteobacteria bacterium]